MLEVKYGRNRNFEFRSLRSLRVFEPVGSTSRLPVNIEIDLLLFPNHFCTDLIKICQDYLIFEVIELSESLEFKFSKFQNFEFLISETGFFREQKYFSMFFTAKYFKTSKLR